MPLALSTYLREVEPHVPGCPVFTVELEILRAAQKLFRESFAWQETLADIPVSAAQQIVLVTPVSAGAELARIEECWFDGRRLDVRTVEQMNSSGSQDWRSHTGAPSAAIQTSPTEVTLYPIPLAAGSLRVFASLSPSDVATELPTELGRRYRDVIVAGAKAALMMYPEKPWTNPGAGAMAQVMFDQGVGSAHHDVVTGFGRGRITARKKWC